MDTLVCEVNDENSNDTLLYTHLDVTLYMFYKVDLKS